MVPNVDVGVCNVDVCGVVICNIGLIPVREACVRAIYHYLNEMN
jgi:hypothetical protein